ncbi:Swarming motility protein YbiA [Variovorax sp. PBS-H4]|uniref:NADAR family protein n=1 Tax=Variovorax sp. PBS-H4 TaxID=434008 RepID=UPI001318D42C|nr:NADAR family protein [Variovorax sp. PBS-H4]VTU38490.1 Swarming motility protein YbiA [Variovorax sp. PBS-H4]
MADLTDDQIDGILRANGWTRADMRDERKESIRDSFRRTLNDAARSAAPPPAAPAEPMTRADRHLLRCAIALVSGPELSEVAGESRGTIAHRLQVMLADSWPNEGEHHGLDTAERVCFYEQDFYVLSNFSSFNLVWEGITFATSEAAYHWEKFATDEDDDERNGIACRVMDAPSAHEAFKIAEQWKHLRRPDWDAVKVGIMRRILRAKADQHDYVRRKLLATGERELVENSWRDDYWGWGPNRDGQNMLGKLWMEVRAELRAASEKAHG